MDPYRNIVEPAELSSIGITRKPLRIMNGRGLRLRVESGSIWITQQDCAEDVYLRADESYCLERDGLTLISVPVKAAFALVAIEPAVAALPTRAERFWKFRERLYAPRACPTTAAL